MLSYDSWIFLIKALRFCHLVESIDSLYSGLDLAGGLREARMRLYQRWLLLFLRWAWHMPEQNREEEQECRPLPFNAAARSRRGRDQPSTLWVRSV